MGIPGTPRAAAVADLAGKKRNNAKGPMSPFDEDGELPVSAAPNSNCPKCRSRILGVLRKIHSRVDEKLQRRCEEYKKIQNANSSKETMQFKPSRFAAKPSRNAPPKPLSSSTTPLHNHHTFSFPSSSFPVNITPTSSAPTSPVPDSLISARNCHLAGGPSAIEESPFHSPVATPTVKRKRVVLKDGGSKRDEDGDGKADRRKRPRKSTYFGLDFEAILGDGYLGVRTRRGVNVEEEDGGACAGKGKGREKGKRKGEVEGWVSRGQEVKQDDRRKVKKGKGKVAKKDEREDEEVDLEPVEEPVRVTRGATKKATASAGTGRDAVQKPERKPNAKPTKSRQFQQTDDDKPQPSRPITRNAAKDASQPAEGRQTRSQVKDKDKDKEKGKKKSGGERAMPETRVTRGSRKR
ncbi:hypothetical protein HK097_005593 [Rhizophlyctis rosea]|uniref:Uncharacterized protein n=1 Tax=Rhizophlyctis rosea TaxID=64517 RepID=A0AAD5SDD3_9FUNG|nr:hypothetical protein HK097_005593 [Rhizophlyctis rosea]